MAKKHRLGARKKTRRVRGTLLIQHPDKHWIEVTGMIHYRKRGSQWCVSSPNPRAGLTGRCYKSLTAAVTGVNKLWPYHVRRR